MSREWTNLGGEGDKGVLPDALATLLVVGMSPGNKRLYGFDAYQTRHLEYSNIPKWEPRADEPLVFKAHVICITQL